MMKEKIEEEKPREASDLELMLLNIITDHFGKGHRNKFDKSMSTLEVLNYLLQICPGEYMAFEVHGILSDAGYVLMPIAGEPEWLFLLK